MSPALSFHIGLLPRSNIQDTAELATLADQLGFGGVWVADSQSIFREAFAALALCAARTHKVKLATGVTNPRTRHPAVIASGIATINELSGGRAILGIGVGESALHTVGLKPARLGDVEEATRVIRALLNGETTVYQGQEIKMTWPRQAVPVYLAASGPKSLQLAGRIADGVLFQVGSDPALVRFALENIERGARQAGRKLRDLQLYARLACSISADGLRAREEIKGYAAAAAGTIFGSIPRKEFPAELWAELKKMKEEYDYFAHASPNAKHAGLITDNILSAVAVAGTPQEAIPRFQELASLGLDGFVIPLTTSDPKQLLRTLAEQVIPHLS